MNQIGKGFVIENKDCFMGRRNFIVFNEKIIYLRILGTKKPKRRNIFVIEDEFEEDFEVYSKRRVITKKQFMKEYLGCNAKKSNGVS